MQFFYHLSSLFKSCLIIVLSLSLLSTVLPAQTFYIQNLRDVEMRPCEVNPDIERLQPINAKIYQTIDDTPFGVLDSTVCPGIADNRLDLSTIRPGLVFLELIIPEENRTEIPGNTLFHFFFPFFGLEIKSGPTLMRIDHEVIQADQSTFTWYEVLNVEDEVFYSQCLRIENFLNAKTHSLIFSIIWEDTVFQRPVNLAFAGFETYDFLDKKIVNISFTEQFSFNGGFRAFLSQIAETEGGDDSYGNYFLSHSDLQEARKGEVEYFDVHAPDRQQPDTLSIIIDDIVNFHIDPYVTMRSDYIFQGSDERHTLQVVQRGDLCIPPFIDFVVEGGVYRYESGHITLTGRGSCILLKKNSALYVADHTHLEYGASGNGMLGLSGASKFKLGKNAQLSILNQLALVKEADEHDMPSVVLKKGQSLSFGPQASVRDMNSLEQDLVLQVFMEGGTFDFGGLDEISRRHIQLIHPAQSETLGNNFKVRQDPVAGYYEIDWIALPQSTGKCTIVDIHGKILQNFFLPQGEGWVTQEISLKEYSAGMYLLIIEMNDQIAHQKLIRY